MAEALARVHKCSETSVLSWFLVPDNGLQFKPGDLVYFYIFPAGKYGTAAEFALVPEDHACLIPVEHVDVFSAAALPLVAATAWQVRNCKTPDVMTTCEVNL